MTLALQGKSRQRQWLLVVLGVMAVLGAVMAAVVARGDARADHPAGTPVSTTLIKAPFKVTENFVGNASCAELDDYYALTGVTWSEVKFDQDTGEIPDAGSNDEFTKDGVTISNVRVVGGNFLFDWESTFGIDAVFVKQGAAQQQLSNIYVYQGHGADPGTEAFLDTGLGPVQGDTQSGAVSHISFCYDGNTPPPADPPTVVKTLVGGGTTATEVSDPADVSWVIEVVNPDIQRTILVRDTGAKVSQVFIAAGTVSCTDGGDPETMLNDSDGAPCLMGPDSEVEFTVYPASPDPLVQTCEPQVFNNTAEYSTNGGDTWTSAVGPQITLLAKTEGCDPIILDPEIEKSFLTNDTENFSWTIEITNFDDEEVKVLLHDPGASLYSGPCTGGDGLWECTVPAADETPGKATVILYTPIPQDYDACKGVENTAYLVTDREFELPADIIDEDTAESGPTSKDCYPIQVCKVFVDNGDGVTTGATEFGFDLDGDPDSITVAEGASDCIVVYVPSGEDVTFSEDPTPFDDASGFPKVAIGGNINAAEEGNSITFRVVPGEARDFTCVQPTDEVFTLLIEAQAIENGLYVCTITFWNQEETPTGRVVIIKYDGVDPGTQQDWTFTGSLPGAPFPIQTFATADAPAGTLRIVNDVPIGNYSLSEAEGRAACSPGAAAGDWQTHGLVISGQVPPPVGDVNAAPIIGSGALNFAVTEGATTYVAFSNRECGNVLETGIIVVHKDTYRSHNNGPAVPQPNDDDGWLITVSSVQCNFNETLATDANGNAVFPGLQLCTDYVVSENPVNPSSPGYSPQGPTSVGGVTPSGQTITFTNAILTFDPGCTNIDQCGPVTLITPTPTPTNTPVPPTATPTNTPVPPTETAIAGERTPGPATPIAPDTGSGSGGNMAAGMNMLLVIAGLLALASGLTVATATRRKR